MLRPKGSMSYSDGAALCGAACVGYGLAQLQDLPTSRSRTTPSSPSWKNLSRSLSHWLVYRRAISPRKCVPSLIS